MGVCTNPRLIAVGFPKKGPGISVHPQHLTRESAFSYLPFPSRSCPYLEKCCPGFQGWERSRPADLCMLDFGRKNFCYKGLRLKLG